MKCNVGRTDRIIRILLGIVIGLLGIYFESWLGLISLIPLATAAIGWCPLYVPFKITTRKEA